MKPWREGFLCWGSGGRCGDERTEGRKGPKDKRDDKGLEGQGEAPTHGDERGRDQVVRSLDVGWAAAPARRLHFCLSGQDGIGGDQFFGEDRLLLLERHPLGRFSRSAWIRCFISTQSGFLLPSSEDCPVRSQPEDAWGVLADPRPRLLAYCGSTPVLRRATVFGLFQDLLLANVAFHLDTVKLLLHRLPPPSGDDSQATQLRAR